MADMFDPSVAESIARSMKQTKTDAAQVARHLSSAADHGARLQSAMMHINDNLSNASKSARSLRQNLAKTGDETAKVSTNSRQVVKSQEQVSQQQVKINKQTGIWKSTLQAVGGKVLYDIIASVRTLETAGFGPLQQATQLFHSTLAAGAVTFKTGYLTSLGDASKAITGMSTRLGGVGMGTEKLLQNALKLSSAYDVSAETTTKLSSMLYRWSNSSDTLVTNTTDYVAALAKANGVAPGAVMKEMADNSEILARYGAQGATNFARMAIQLVRMGTTFKEMDGFADKIVNDFESTLTMTAKIQTIMPGFDISEVMMASQFGTPEQVGEALQSALKGSGLNDLAQLPRSLQNMLSSSLGMNKETLQNLMHPPKAADAKLKPPTKADFDEKMDVAVNWLKIIALTIGVGAGLNMVKGMIKGSGTTSKLLQGALPAAEGAAAGAKPLGRFGKLFASAATREAATGSPFKPLASQHGIGTRLVEFLKPAQASNVLKELPASRTAGMLGKAAGAAGAGLAGGISAYSTYKETGSKGMAAGAGVGATAGGIGGAALGTLIAPGIGTVIGGMIGSVAGEALGKGLASLFVDKKALAEKQRKADELTAIETEKLAKQTSLLTSMFDKLGGKSIEYAKVAHAFITGNARKFDNNVRSKGAAGITGEVQSSMMSRQGGGGNSYINDMSFGPAKIKEMMKQSGLGQSVMGLAGKASGLLGGGLGGLVSAGKSGIGSLLGGIGGKAIGGLMTGGVGTALSLASSVFPGIGKTLGQVAKNPLGSVVNFAKNPGKAIGSVFKGIGGLFGKKKPTVQSVATAIAPLAPKILDGGLSKILGSKLGGQVSGAMQGITVNTQALESKMDQLITLFKRGGINVNMDGKKVSTSLAHANRYG